jgi:hypothetical protein
MYDKLGSDFISENEYYFVNPSGGGSHGTYMAQFWNMGKMVGAVEYDGMGY